MLYKRTPHEVPNLIQNILFEKQKAFLNYLLTCREPDLEKACHVFVGERVPWLQQLCAIILNFLTKIMLEYLILQSFCSFTEELNTYIHSTIVQYST